MGNKGNDEQWRYVMNDDAMPPEPRPEPTPIQRTQHTLHELAKLAEEITGVPLSAETVGESTRLTDDEPLGFHPTGEVSERVEAHGFAIGDRVRVEWPGPDAPSEFFGKLVMVPEHCPMARSNDSLCKDICTRFVIETSIPQQRTIIATASQLEHAD